MRKIILGLVFLNVALAGYLAFKLARPSPAAFQSAAIDDSLDGAHSPAHTAAAAAPKAAAPVKADWTSVASPDLHRYAANLRRVGCPEQTIKDIMLAEVNRRYSTQEQALKARPDDVPPWEMPSSSERRGRESKLRQLLEEKRNMLKELAGVDVGIDMPSRLAGRDADKYEGAYNAVPTDKRDQVRAIQENYWAQSDDIKQRTLGYLEPEDRDEFLRIKRERRDALAQVLSPRELQDYELKTSETASNLRSRFDGFNVADEEFRKIFDYLQPLDEQYSLNRRNPDPLDNDFTASRTQAEKDVAEYIKSVLGDDRYAEYERTRDPAYKAISQVGAEAGWTQETILQAYQAQQQMQDQSKKIAQDPGLSPEQRTAAMQQLQAEAQQRAVQMFGDKASEILKRFPNVRLAERYGLPANDVQVIRNPGVALP